MLERLRSDESGMTMGLTVIMVVLIGVMGAGLLVFVQRDLNAVIEVNQGQQAFGAADAGAEAARQQLISNACPGSYYDEDDRDDLIEGEDDCEISDWSYSEGGKELELDGQEMNVQIRYLKPSQTESEIENPEHAPEVEEGEDDERNFFAVDAVGGAGDANRRVQGIYVSTGFSIPKTYFATRNIEIAGNSARIEATSIFAEGDVRGVRNNTMQGSEDLVYGDWEEAPHNTEPRGSSAPGIGAEGRICYGSSGGGSCNSSSDRKDGGIDYDSLTDPSFLPNTWPDGEQPDGAITYPFDKSEVDEELVDLLRQVARDQGNHFSEAGGTTFNIGGNNGTPYPEDSDQSTVYFVEFTGAKGLVNYRLKEDPLPEGTIVVVNGDLETSSSASGYKGIFMVRDPNNVGLTYKDAGNFSLEGYANIEGDLELRGSISPFGSEGASERPGFQRVSLWSWRESYEPR